MVTAFCFSDAAQTPTIQQPTHSHNQACAGTQELLQNQVLNKRLMYFSLSTGGQRRDFAIIRVQQCASRQHLESRESSGQAQAAETRKGQGHLHLVRIDAHVVPTHETTVAPLQPFF
jgi:hypothetical protein